MLKKNFENNKTRKKISNKSQQKQSRPKNSTTFFSKNSNAQKAGCRKIWSMILNCLAIESEVDLNQVFILTDFKKAGSSGYNTKKAVSFSLVRLFCGKSSSRAWLQHRVLRIGLASTLQCFKVQRMFRMNYFLDILKIFTLK